MKTLSSTNQNSFWGVMKIMLCIIFLSSSCNTWSQEVTKSKVETHTTSNQNQAQTQTNLESQNTAELGDIQNEELEAFDVSTIPESVPIPDANWVFEVPVDVKNIPPEITKIVIQAIVFKFMKDGERVDFGKAQKRLDLLDGAFSGNVMIGVEYSEDMVRWAKKKYTGEFFPSDAEKYECWMYLIGPDNSWKEPSLKQVIPSWRMASPNNPFRWKTEPQPLPANYVSSTGTYDAGSVGEGNSDTPQGLNDISIPNQINNNDSNNTGGIQISGKEIKKK